MQVDHRSLQGAITLPNCSRSLPLWSAANAPFTRQDVQPTNDSLTPLRKRCDQPMNALDRRLIAFYYMGQWSGSGLFPQSLVRPIILYKVRCNVSRFHPDTKQRYYYVLMGDNSSAWEKQDTAPAGPGTDTYILLKGGFSRL